MVAIASTVPTVEEEEEDSDDDQYNDYENSRYGNKIGENGGDHNDDDDDDTPRVPLADQLQKPSKSFDKTAAPTVSPATKCWCVYRE